MVKKDLTGQVMVELRLKQGVEKAIWWFGRWVLDHVCDFQNVKQHVWVVSILFYFFIVLISKMGRKSNFVIFLIDKRNETQNDDMCCPVPKGKLVTELGFKFWSPDSHPLSVIALCSVFQNVFICTPKSSFLLKSHFPISRVKKCLMIKGKKIDQ